MWSMVDKRANIDLLFRNGLKEFEVLPPAEAWNNILPVIRKKQKPVLLLRSAAFVAILLSISFLAYRMSRQAPSAFRNPVFALDQESVGLPENPGDRLTAGIVSAPDRQPAVFRQDQISVATSGNESVEEIIYAHSDRDFAREFRSLDISNNLMIAPNIQAIRGTTYIADNTDTEYEKLYDPGFEDKKEKFNKWSVTAMASPTYYLRPELSSNEISNQITSSEQSRISYSGGVGFAYKINKKLSIQSGLYFSSVGNEVDDIRSFAGFRQFDFTKGDHNFEVLTSSGRIYTENPDVFLVDNSGDRVMTKYTSDVFDPAKANLSYINNTLFQNFSYLEMPVFVRYKLVDRSIDFNLIGGLSYNLLVSNSVHTVIAGNKYDIGKTEGLNTFMVSSSLGMGMEYNLSKKISLNLEPTFRYYINPFSNIRDASAHPYSFGLFSGLSYKF